LPEKLNLMNDCVNFEYLCNDLDDLNKTNSIDMSNNKTWHEKHKETSGFGSRLADTVAKGMGSWRFIIIQTVFVIVWMGLNLVGYAYHWDAYPFILLNLVFSTQAAYAAPIIMMSQNRQSERDRIQAQSDYQTNIDAKLEIEALTIKLDKIETEKLDKIIAMLEEMKSNSNK
jgi:uncharacterized membrane protein